MNRNAETLIIRRWLFDWICATLRLATFTWLRVTHDCQIKAGCYFCPFNCLISSYSVSGHFGFLSHQKSKLTDLCLTTTSFIKRNSRKFEFQIKDTSLIQMARCERSAAIGRKIWKFCAQQWLSFLFSYKKVITSQIRILTTALYRIWWSFKIWVTLKAK